ncbi:MAG: diguanylate cyclase [Syntrophorhabdales bacterium]|nr:diguanylate cyclase [Syntrophorhabdales bacterium]
MDNGSHIDNSSYTYPDWLHDKNLLNIIDNLPDASFIIDENRRVVAWNRAIEEMTGVKKEDILGKGDYEYAIPFYGKRRPILIDLLFRGDEKIEGKYDFVSKRGNTLYAEVFAPELYRGKGGYLWGSASRLYNENGKFIGAIESIRDITEWKKVEALVRESEERFRALFEGSRDAIYFTEGNGNLIDGNQAFIEMFGYSREELKRLNARIAYADENEMGRLKQALKKNDFVKDFEIRLKKRDGSVMACLLTVSCRRDVKGRIYEYQGIVRDITERKRAEEAMKYMAFHDMLTGLPNRSLFNDRLNVALARGERFEKIVAVMMLDLDRFKDVNDTYGHTTGDRLLRAVAKRLMSQIRRGDTVARMGGDEFILIFTDLKDRYDAKIIAQKIIEEFKPAIHFDGMKINITISIGIALYPEHGRDIDTLVKNADIAMYKVKNSGRNGYSFYDGSDLDSLSKS